MTSDYLVPDIQTERGYQIKKSRFIARLSRVCDRNQAMIELANAKRDYPDARHHCWAYLIGPPTNPLAVSMSDDGEPGGTAGKPIYNVIQHKDIGNIMIIVIRYFGGIKLGAGGLVRAYSQAAQQVCEITPTRRYVRPCHYTVECSFGDEQIIRHWLSQHEGNILKTQYQEQARIDIALAAQHFHPLKVFLDQLKDCRIAAARERV